jgi:EAL domain-containing protein (putative c-di-GMP-specific phosphodiesterase class I)
MSTNSQTSSRIEWFLIGPFDTNERTRCLPIYTFPFLIGRRQDLALTLCCNTVSCVHAEISEIDQSLIVRDLGSTNGTYVNGRRINGAVVLHADDLVQFANMAFRIQKQSIADNSQTVHVNACDRALALVQFDKLITDHVVTPLFQPIVLMATKKVVSYEALGSSRLFGLQTPAKMFLSAAELNLDIELSVMLRWESLLASQALTGPPHLFLNTHPRELAAAGLIASLELLRKAQPDQQLTLEIHESAVTNAVQMAELKSALTNLNISLAYDDFGCGQSRLYELSECSPDYVKFDMSLIRDIDTASPQRQEVVTVLVQMVHNLGIVTLAEGIETQAEDDACSKMGFDLGQGFFYGRPVPARKLQPPS